MASSRSALAGFVAAGAGADGSAGGSRGALSAGGGATARIWPLAVRCMAGLDCDTTGGAENEMTLRERSVSSDVRTCESGRPVRLASSRSPARPSIRERMKPSAALRRRARSALGSTTTLGIRPPSANQSPRTSRSVSRARGGGSAQPLCQRGRSVSGLFRGRCRNFAVRVIPARMHPDPSLGERADAA